MKRSKILVTGGSGFCGTAMIRLLLSRGCQVRNFDLETPSRDIQNAEFMRGNLCHSQEVLQAVQGMDGVIHMAAKVPISKAGKQFWAVNVEGTRNVLEAAHQAGITKVVHISSSAVQLSHTNPVPEDAPCHPVEGYSQSKRDAELVCFDFRDKGMRVDVIRPRVVVGLGRLGIFDILFDWILEGRRIYLMGNGQNKIQFLHVEDLAELCFRCVQTDLSDTYNVGSKNFGTLNEDLGSLLAFAGTGSRLVHLPVWPVQAALALLDFLKLSPLAAWHYLTYHRSLYFSNEKAQKLLGWIPQYGNQEILKIAYTDYKRARQTGQLPAYGSSHRKSLKQGLLGLLKKLS
ncbi:MAG: NAD-dependent epimerase/dehydratase family protein [Candidatus Omnitrophica bacterium]|nr:NAD-dependent epimerase/dehydratase family protein [Candidatus Omnitrophota bacterium]